MHDSRSTVRWNDPVTRSLLACACVLLLGDARPAGACELEASLVSPRGTSLNGGQAVAWKVRFRNVGRMPCSGKPVSWARIQGTTGRGGRPTTVGGRAQSLRELKANESQEIVFSEKSPPTSGQYTYELVYGPGPIDPNPGNHEVSQTVTFRAAQTAQSSGLKPAPVSQSAGGGPAAPKPGGTLPAADPRQTTRRTPSVGGSQPAVSSAPPTVRRSYGTASQSGQTATQEQADAVLNPAAARAGRLTNTTLQRNVLSGEQTDDRAARLEELRAGRRPDMDVTRPLTGRADERLAVGRSHLPVQVDEALISQGAGSSRPGASSDGSGETDPEAAKAGMLATGIDRAALSSTVFRVNIDKDEPKIVQPMGPTVLFGEPTIETQEQVEARRLKELTRCNPLHDEFCDNERAREFYLGDACPEGQQVGKDGRCYTPSTQSCPDGQEKNAQGDCDAAPEGDDGSDTASAGGCLENEVEQPDGECVCSEGMERNSKGVCVANGAGEAEPEDDGDSKPNPMGNPMAGDYDPGVFYGQGAKDLVGMPSGEGGYVIEGQTSREAMREGVMGRARDKMGNLVDYTQDMDPPGEDPDVASPPPDDKCQFAGDCPDGSPDVR